MNLKNKKIKKQEWQDSWTPTEFLEVSSCYRDEQPVVLSQSGPVSLPISFLKRTIDPLYAEGLRINNLPYIHELMASLRAEGLREPGTLIISPMQVKLQDGNHRLIAHELLGWPEFPVKVEFSDGKMNAGLNLQTLVKELLYAKRI